MSTLPTCSPIWSTVTFIPAKYPGNTIFNRLASAQTLLRIWTSTESEADLEGDQAGSGPSFGRRADAVTHGHVS